MNKSFITLGPVHLTTNIRLKMAFVLVPENVDRTAALVSNSEFNDVRFRLGYVCHI